MAVKTGDILGGKYRIDALIGRGGMGHVFTATDLSGPGAPVAIKVVSRVTFDETLLARLHREAEAAARIRSDYVPHVLEVSDTAEREMYMVMERLVGEPLSQRMRDKGFLSWPEVAQIGQDVLRGLIDAHTAGVVHRDIKPSNVFLAKKGDRERAMVLDFGVCKTDTVDKERLTGTGEAIGTVAYMAPEQIRGASKVDDRADLYSFGVVVYEMLSGKLPHDGPSQMAILASKLENTPTRLRDATRVMIPEGLDELVARTLARDPSVRFASAQELLKAWRKLGTAEISASVPPGAIANPPSDEDLHDTLSRGSEKIAPDDADLAPTQIGGEVPVPVDVHPTQTALTAPGISLRKGGQGRVAVVLAAAALVAGVIGVVAFFAKGPESGAEKGSAAAAAGASSGAAPASSGSESSPSASSEAPAASAVVELGDVPPGSSATLSTPAVKRTPVVPKTTRATKTGAAPAKSSGPHITSQPRY